MGAVSAVWSAGRGCGTFGARTHNGSRKDFLREQRSLLSQFLLFLLPDQCRHIVPNNICIYTHNTDTVQTVYELPSLPNNTAAKHFYTNLSGAKC